MVSGWLWGFWVGVREHIFIYPLLYLFPDWPIPLPYPYTYPTVNNYDSSLFSSCLALVCAACVGGTRCVAAVFVVTNDVSVLWREKLRW